MAKHTNYHIGIIILILMVACPDHSYSQEVNQEMIKAITSKDISLLMDLYAPDAVSMPEYHSALYGKKNIQRYYEARFKASTVTDYTRTTHDSKPLGDYVVETGTYSYTYTLTGKAPLAYTGKYLIVWRANKEKELKIISEIWGSDTYLERASLAFPESNTSAYPPSPDLKIKTDTEKQITERNTFVSDGVKARDGVKISTVYEEDAMYLPYYSPMLIGKDQITEYYLKHEDPAVTIDSVQIKASRILVSGNYAFVDGYYGVKWRAGENSGIVTGKSINIWRRNKQGVYMLYRQMTNHD